MASEKQLRANRENAKRSTGPRTPEGKASSSANALRHGFSASSIDLFPVETQDLYLTFREDFHPDFLPATKTEKLYFEHWAFAQFLSLRAQSSEAQALAQQQAHPGDPLYSNELAKAARYSRGLASAAGRAKRELDQLQANRYAAHDIQDIITHAKNSDVQIPPNAPLHKMLDKGGRNNSREVAIRIIHQEMSRRYQPMDLQEQNLPQQNEPNPPRFKIEDADEMIRELLTACPELASSRFDDEDED